MVDCPSPAPLNKRLDSLSSDATKHIKEYEILKFHDHFQCRAGALLQFHLMITPVPLDNIQIYGRRGMGKTFLMRKYFQLFAKGNYSWQNLALYDADVKGRERSRIYKDILYKMSKGESTNSRISDVCELAELIVSIEPSEKNATFFIVLDEVHRLELVDPFLLDSLISIPKIVRDKEFSGTGNSGLSRKKLCVVLISRFPLRNSGVDTSVKIPMVYFPSYNQNEATDLLLHSFDKALSSAKELYRFNFQDNSTEGNRIRGSTEVVVEKPDLKLKSSISLDTLRTYWASNVQEYVSLYSSLYKTDFKELLFTTLRASWPVVFPSEGQLWFRKNRQLSEAVFNHVIISPIADRQAWSNGEFSPQKSQMYNFPRNMSAILASAYFCGLLKKPRQVKLLIERQWGLIVSRKKIQVEVLPAPSSVFKLGDCLLLADALGSTCLNEEGMTNSWNSTIATLRTLGFLREGNVFSHPTPDSPAPHLWYPKSQNEVTYIESAKFGISNFGNFRSSKQKVLNKNSKLRCSVSPEDSLFSMLGITKDSVVSLSA
eukprot:GHVP01015156.1.p1 GENE.GHVP01015156.1~~GHVP01015156.1.p1  ORF type:complete len:544 (-),score=77.72 GHVP01015156.1:2224-3855(-)